MAVIRLDLAELATPVLDDDGVLHVEAIATRAGVFDYRDASGLRKEYRPADEVFSAAAMSSLRGATVTVGHQEMVTPANVRALRVGVVEGEPRRDGDLLAVQLRLDEPSTIDAVMRGTLRELSLGYKCDIELQSGVTPNGERYDMIQKNHKNNHVALLPAGKARAGSIASIRLDEGDAIQEAAAEAVEAVTEAVAEAVTEAVSEAVAPAAEPEPEIEITVDLAPIVEELRARVASLEALLAAAVSRADSAEGSLKTFRRAKLEADVAAVLPDERMDGVEDAELQARVITKFLPPTRLDGVSEDFRSGLFAAALSVAHSGQPAQPKQLLGGPGRVVDPVAQARAERDAANAAAWRGNRT